MLTILTGLSSALAYASSDTLSQRASRAADVTRVVAWVLLLGLALILPLALIVEGVPSGGAQWRAAGLAALSGIAYLAGYRSLLEGLRRGDLSLVAALSSLSGAFTAVIALLRGEHMSAMVGLGLALAVSGGLLAAFQGRAKTAAGAGWAVLSGLCYMGVLLCYDYSTALGPLSIAAASRLTAVLIAVPVALACGGMAMERRLFRLVVPSGVLEALGLVLAVISVAIGPLAVSGVMQAQFATFGALIGFAFLGERLARHQILGIVLTISGVTILAALG